MLPGVFAVEMATILALGMISSPSCQLFCLGFPWWTRPDARRANRRCGYFQEPAPRYCGIFIPVGFHFRRVMV